MLGRSEVEGCRVAIAEGDGVVLRRAIASCGVLVVAACGGSSGAAETTAAVVTTAATTAPPETTTTVPPTTATPTTAAPATAAPTTAAPTTAATTVPASAEEAVRARLAAYNEAEDTCFETPAECDPVALVNEFADGPDGSLARYVVALAEERTAKNLHRRPDPDIERKVHELVVQSDDQVAVAQCFRNAAILVDANDVVVDDSVGYGQSFMEWTKQDGRWIITGFDFSLFDVDSPGSVACGMKR